MLNKESPDDSFVTSNSNDMGQPGWRLHPLKGDEAGTWAVEVNGNWGLTFMFDGDDAVLVDYRDYY
ncbi:type II toxin-antitoxin system RelE/ParE family toxin [Burkholderia gladioli]|uniref:type II toxin-antitoxin system RelE/ParE family toxin n=1 Tax=Burkholderia gladioli TaxID=28095 RepID=UPI003132CE7E